MTHWTSRLIRELRVESGLTLTALSDLTDISRHTIANCERGDHKSNIEMVDAILEGLGFELEVVPLDGIGEPIKAKDNSNGANRKR